MALAPEATGRGEGLIGWAEPITGSAENAKPCLKKQEKNKQDPPFSAESLAFGSGSREITGDYPVQVSETESTR